MSLLKVLETLEENMFSTMYSRNPVSETKSVSIHSKEIFSDVYGLFCNQWKFALSFNVQEDGDDCLL